MNIAKLQGTISIGRNWLDFYTVAINNFRRKLRKRFQRKRKKFKQDFYTENYRTLLKEIKEDLNRQKDIHAQRLKDVIFTSHYCLEQSTGSVQSLSKSQMLFLQKRKI